MSAAAKEIDAQRERLRFLRDIAAREAVLLAETDTRLFDLPVTADRLRDLATEPELSERIDAYVARLSRLQDGLADRLLPALLRWLAESVGPTIDNINRAEKLSWLASADAWMDCRRLRNRLIHEYVQDAGRLAG